MRVLRFLNLLRKAAAQAFAHDAINTAKAVAYSGILMMFPALLVITTLMAQVPEGTTMSGEFRNAFVQFLPSETMSMLQSYILVRRSHSSQVVLSAASLSVFAALGMMLSLMEGFRRAYRLPRDSWGFWERRARAFLLVPIALVPLALATLVIVFGHQIEGWMIKNAVHDLRHVVLFFWRMVRWSIALITSIAVLTVIYHFGTKRKEPWFRVAPGAVTGTLLWFPATLAFGWYVTRIANYSMFYGSFGAGIATLVWLYITAFSVLIGGELNGALFRERQAQGSGTDQYYSSTAGR
jgi:membrane protein